MSVYFIKIKCVNRDINKNLVGQKATGVWCAKYKQWSIKDIVYKVVMILLVMSISLKLHESKAKLIYDVL